MTQFELSIKKYPLNFFQSYALLVVFFLPFYFIRFKIGWFATNFPEALIAFFLLAWLAFHGKKSGWISVFSHPFLADKLYLGPILLILSGVVMSIISGKNYYAGLGILKGWFLLPAFFSFFLFYFARESRNFIDKIFQTIFYSGFLLSVFGWIYVFSGKLTYDGRLNLFYDSPNQLAMSLAVPFFTGLAYLSKTKNKFRNNPFFSFAFMSIGLNLFFTKSYGAWFAILAAIGYGIYMLQREKKQKKVFFVFFILLLILISAVALYKFRAIENLGSRSSLASRIMIWKSALLIGKDNPLLGIGPGNFQSKYLEYHKYFPPYLEWSVPQPHNLFLAFWLESGLIGLAGFILLLIKFFRDNKKAINNDRLRGVLLLSTMLYFLLHGLVDTTYWKNDLAVYFWLVIAINSILSQENLKIKEKKNQQSAD